MSKTTTLVDKSGGAILVRVEKIILAWADKDIVVVLLDGGENPRLEIALDSAADANTAVDKIRSAIEGEA